MATGIDSRITAIQDEFLSCKICFEDLDQPKTLPCLHTFCLKCLDKHAKRNRQPGNKFACPICRRDCLVPEKGIQDFPTNFMLQELKGVVSKPTGEADAEQNKPKCGNHPEVESRWFCSTCRKCFCQDCMEVDHKKASCFLFDLTSGQTIDKLYQQQQMSISTLQNKIEKWSDDSNEMTSKVEQIQKAKQILQDQTNTLYSRLEEKLLNEKKLMQEFVDQIFVFDTDPEVFLKQMKDFQEEVKETRTFLSSEPKTLAVQTLADFDEKLNSYSHSLQDKYSSFSGAIFQQLPKANLKFSQKSVNTIMSKPLVEIEKSSNVTDITCSCLNEFSAKFSSETKITLDELMCVGNTIYVVDTENKSVKMMDQQGNGLAKFHDVTRKNSPRSLCLLANHTIAVGYAKDVVKLFDLDGKFRKMLRIGVNLPKMILLSDGTIAISHGRNCIDFYDQNFERRLDIESIECCIFPKLMCAYKDDNLFYSANGDFYYCARSKKEIGHSAYNLSWDSDTKYDPTGLCIDRWGNVLVASCKYSKIHIFFQEADGSWNDRVLLDQKKDKLHQPRTLAFNEKGELVVAQNNGKIKIFSYSWQ